MIALLTQSAVRALVLALLAWTGVRLFRVRDPRLENRIWVAVLLGSLAIPALLAWRVVPLLPLSALEVRTHGVLQTTVTVSGPWATAFLCLYAGTSGFLTLRLLAGVGRMWRIRNGSRAVPLSGGSRQDVRVADGLASPVTFGSTILIPADYVAWSPHKRASILAHERSHVVHLDCHIQWLAGLHVCLFWFSPLPWWLRRRLAQLAEFASDQAALEKNLNSADYAATLLELARRTRPARWVTTSMSAGDLERRIDRILAFEHPEYPPRASRSSRRLLAVLAMVPVTALVAQTATRPYIVSAAPFEQLEKWYPRAAIDAGVGGLVQVTVTVDANGRPTRTVVISESPAAMGFGTAATEMARTLTYINPTGHSAPLTYKVKFELNQHRKDGT
jgi:TonB family protein